MTPIGMKLGGRCELASHVYVIDTPFIVFEWPTSEYRTLRTFEQDLMQIEVRNLGTYWPAKCHYVNVLMVGKCPSGCG